MKARLLPLLVLALILCAPSLAVAQTVFPMSVNGVSVGQSPKLTFPTCTSSQALGTVGGGFACVTPPGTGTSVTGTGIWYSLSGSLNGSAVTPSGDVSISSLSGSNLPFNVLAAHGATIPAAGSLTIGNILQVSGSSALSYGALNLGGGSNYVTGTLPAGNQASQTLGGDLSGTTASGTVLSAQGGKYTFDSSGNYLNFGSTTSNATASIRADGSTFTYVNAPTGGAVAQILNNSSFLSYANISAYYFGGSSASTANWYFDRSTSGQLHASTALTVPGIFQDTPGSDVATVDFVTQAQSAYASASTNVTGANAIVKAGAPASSNGISGNVDASYFAPTASATTEAGFRVRRGGTQVGRIGLNENGAKCLWLGTGTDAAHCSLLGDGSSYVYMNAPNGSAFGWVLGDATFAQYYSGGLQYFGGSSSSAAPIYFDEGTASIIHFGGGASSSATIKVDDLTSNSGTGVSLAIHGQNETGTSSTGGTVSINSGTGTSNQGNLAFLVGATTVSLLDGTHGSGLGLQNTSQSLGTSGGTITPSAATAIYPVITLTGTIPAGGTTLTMPNVAGLWWLDVTSLTFNGILTFKSGSGTCGTISSLTTNDNLIELVALGSNTCRINL